MPYNTRRKSLSLPSLGIHVPVNRPSPNTATTATSRSAPDSSNQPPAKRVKRSHSNESGAHPSALVPSKQVSAPQKTSEHTPPPTPGLHSSIESDESEVSPPNAIDLSGVNDDIVEAVLARLQSTQNRPHLVKELAASTIASQIPSVKQSANPSSIIASRLASFMKRSCWSPSKPCPLAKELEAVHPRRTYYYLTTSPHQPLPLSSAVELNQRDLVTPSLSSSIDTDEDVDGDRRRELSMSPEVDLSSHEFENEDEIPIPGVSSGHASGGHRTCHVPMPRGQRGEEPALEKDEKEFTQTADGLQKRKLVGGLLSAEPIDAPMVVDDGSHNELLFGEPHRSHLVPMFPSYMAFMTSPAMRPTMMPQKKDEEAETWTKLDAMLDWDKSPETVELDELDGLLNGF